MRLNEIEINVDDLRVIAQRIRENCKPFLKLIDNDVREYIMYRGMEFSIDPIQRKKVRLDDRKPMSSSPIKHERYNHYFQEVFGAPFRNSLHTTGDVSMAEYYGDPFVIFPIGEFEFLWSPDVNDMTLDIRWPSVGGHINVPPSQEAVDDKLEFAGYRHNRDMAQAIKSGNEIMIRSKNYYAVKPAIFERLKF